jgi:hypothetical protein
MKGVLAFGLGLAIASGAYAQRKEINGHWYHFFPDQASAKALEAGHAHGGHGGGGSTAKLVYHNGPTIQYAHVVPVFWGSYWANGTGAAEASTMISFFEQFGTNAEYNTIAQYYDTVGGGTNYIGLTTLLSGSSGAYFDTASEPASGNCTTSSPCNVTDAAVQAEVVKAVNAKGYDGSAIYEVFIGPAYFSSYGSSGSCGANGGVSLAYCAYHSNFSSQGHDVKYSIEPYPSCSGCHASGFSTVQDAQHFACHETREAVTDEDGNAWYDNRGYEADDECAWTYKRKSTTFIDGGYGYQQEWSNEANNCVSTR